MRIIVLDQTHGGDAIGGEYAKLGHQVTVVDVYHTNDEVDVQKARSMGLRVLDRPPQEHFDLAVVPVYSPDALLQPSTYSRRISHHQAVGELVGFDFPIIEVTGTIAKTSTCHVLAHMLSRLGLKVLLHTSEGDVEYGEGGSVTNEGTGIAPASIIGLSRLKGYDIAVVDVSFGNTGLGKVTVITDFGELEITDGMTGPSDNKVPMRLDGRCGLVAPHSEVSRLTKLVGQEKAITSFGPDGSIGISFEEKLQLGVPLRGMLRFGKEHHEVELASTYLPPAYSTAIQAAVAACSAYGFGPEKIAMALEGFKGAPGRTEVEREGEWYMVRERNRAVGPRSISWVLDVLQERFGVNDIGLVIDPMDAGSAKALDVDGLIRTAISHPSVKKVYYFDRDLETKDYWPSLHHIKGAFEVWAQHRVLLWCTKEGRH